MSLLKDPKIMKSVSQIPQRSEREQNIEKLVKSFVDTGILPQLANRNNQIMFGRRGTGKTHILKVLPEKIDDCGVFSHVFIDMRTLGSNTQRDPARTAEHNAILILKDILSAIHTALLDFATSDAAAVNDKGFSVLDDLATAFTKVASLRTEQKATDRVKAASQNSESSGIEVKLGKDPSVGVKDAGTDQESEEAERTLSYKIVEHHHVVFNEVFQLLEDAIRSIGMDHFFVLIDEWTAIDAETQPYVAEYLKRTVLPSNLMTLKIASLEYRSEFSTPGEKNSVLGFELGADISANLDLDEYYVFDKNRDGVIAAFEELLYKHLDTELPEGYLAEFHNISSAKSLVQGLFTANNTFAELVRAAEGVARDFINILSQAFFDSQKRGRDKMDVQSITEAARQWYERDKHPQLDRVQEMVLSRIMSDVIGIKKARSFMVKRSGARHPLIQGLFDYRVIHLIQRGYADKANPGARYNIYTLDYGTYVDLLKTQQRPELDFPDIDGMQDKDDRVVPFDDKRSIRRIILTEEQLKAWSEGEGAEGDYRVKYE